MEYPEPVRSLLRAAKAKEGDAVRVVTRRGPFEGVVMPHHEFSGPDILTLKLPNGYNVGLPAAEITSLQATGTRTPAAKPPRPPPAAGSKPVVALLGTGGTIASYVDYRTGAVHPALTAEELVFSVPELAGVARLRSRVLYRLYSENVRVEHWQRIAREVAAELAQGAVGVVVPHGTDTMGYTAAALSFMLRNLPGPVVLVGSQRSSDRPSSDAAANLLAATRLATADLGEVVACMHGETSDTYCAVHRGTKVRKMHTSRRDAFRSINAAPLGKVWPDGRVELAGHRPRAGPLEMDDRVEPNVALVWFHPGLSPDALRALVERAAGTVVAGTGLGHVASELIPVLRDAVAMGKPVVLTSQCLYGRTGLRVYDTGRDLLKAGAIAGEDMLPETAYVKLMWVLGRTRDLEEVRRLMASNLAGEINPALALDEFTD